MLKLITKRRKLLSIALTLFSMVLFQYHANAQNKTVTGKVTDSKGLALPGVSVVGKGEKAGVITDIDGQFRLQIEPQTTTIVFSYIGFHKKEVGVEGQAVLNVVLEESMSQLNEVVVVGYGTQKRSNVIGSVAQITSDDLKQAPTMNITNMLAGRLPGLTTLQQSGRPGADDATLRIRGIGTYGRNQGPVVIVDGVERSFAQLDPNEIESISLLKDAVSAAVYGLQAANGVILVTTKRGKNQKPTISYESSLSVNSNTRFPEFLNGPDYMQWFSKAEEMDNDFLINTNQDPKALSYTQAQIDALRNGTNTNPLFGNTDWVGELLGKTSTTQSHAITVRGGTEKIKYFSSLGFLDQDGIVENTGYKRYNLRTNLDAQLNSVFSVSLDLGARLQKTNTPGISPDNTSYMNPFYQAVRTLPNMPKYAPNGLPTAHFSNAGYVNPLASIEQSGYQNGETNAFQSTLTFNVKVPWVKGLAGKLLVSYDKNATENKGWTTPYLLMGRPRIPKASDNYTLIDNPPGITVNTLRQSYSQNNRQSFQPSITYNTTIKDHKINALALYEWSKNNGNLFSTGARNFAIPDLQEIDFGSQDPDHFIIPTGSSSIKAREGLVGRINYSYKDKYLFEAAARFDASIFFPVQGRWGGFPSVGLGWIATEETFFKQFSNTLSFLKLKGSWGKLGNDVTTTPFDYLNTFSYTDPVVVIGGVPTSAFATNAPANPNLTWEVSTVTNIGLESEFWNGKLGVDFEWFYKVTENILTGVSGLYPPSIGGYFPATVNSGIADNRGFDLQLRHRNKFGKLGYSVTGNLNWARNKIIRINENNNLPYWQRRTGRPIGEKMGFVVDGFYQSWEEARNGSSPSSGTIAPGFFKYTDLNGDGRVTRDADMTFVGRSNLPELMYGLNLELNYAGFDFSALFQGAALSSIALGGLYEGSSGTSGIEDNSPFTKTFYGYGNSPYYLVEQSWTPENPNAKYPRLTSGGVALSPHNANANSGFIVNNDYLRLKTIQLGYTLPKSLFKSKIDACRFYVTGFNLFTWDKLKYLDPEMPNVNNGFYPQQKMISGGVNLTF